MVLKWLAWINASLFGEVLYALPFGQAIARKLLTDYRVVIIGVDDPTITEWITNRDLVTTATGLETDTESLAAQIGVLKAIKDYDLKRVISFHNRVKRAEAFTTEVQQVMAWIGDEHRPSGTLRTDFVSGDMPASKRKLKLDQLKALNADERAVLSNARCLSEGVDVPSLDGVAFVDPRSSQVDIIQAVGRAIRLSPNKKVGTIILPVFIAAGQDAEEAIEASHFKPIWGVLNALKAHDDELAAELDQVRTGLGKRPGSSVQSNSLRKISFDLPASVDAAFGDALRTHLVEQVTASWNFWFGLLEAYVDREGHCQVPRAFQAIDGYRLGNWVSAQRINRDRLSGERKALLEELSGWTWDPFADKWEEGFRYLKQYVGINSVARPSQDYSASDGYRLGKWVSVQRGKKDETAADRKDRLEALPGWIWNSNEASWDEGLRKLKEFAVQEGHARPSKEFKSLDGYRLGGWVNDLRTKRESLPSERISELEAIPGWVWNEVSERWDDGFRFLTEFSNREGHCHVKQTYRTTDGYRLGQWVQKVRNRKDDIEPERIERLMALPGWAWDMRDEKWEIGYRHLKEFSEHAGHCLPVKQYKSQDGYSLGGWVSVQRVRREDLPEARRAQLEELSGWVWDAIAEKWEQGFHCLAIYYKKEGHCNVPANYKTDDGQPLGNWVGNRRHSKDKMDPAHRERLEAQPG